LKGDKPLVGGDGCCAQSESHKTKENNNMNFAKKKQGEANKHKSKAMTMKPRGKQLPSKGDKPPIRGQ
jgi:hypothetical protein